MANSEDKSKVVAKIVKLFLEFLIAAVVAWFGASCTHNFFKPKIVNYVQTSFLY